MPDDSADKPTLSVLELDDSGCESSVAGDGGADHLSESDVARIVAIRASTRRRCTADATCWSSVFPAPSDREDRRKLYASRWEWSERTISTYDWPAVCALVDRHAGVNTAQWLAEHLLYPLEFAQSMLERHGPASRARWLTDDQRAFVVLALAGYNVFVTGRAGTGKSVAVRVLVHTLQAVCDDSMFVCSTTGVSACNIGGVTLDSAFLLQLQDPRQWRPPVKKRHTDTEIVLCDELSMLEPLKLYELHFRLAWAKRERRAEQLAAAAAADPSQRTVSSFFAPPNGAAVAAAPSLAAASEVPMGGVQVIGCGDFFQLPPVYKQVIGGGDARLQAEALSRDATNYAHMRPELVLCRQATYAFQVPLFYTVFRHCVYLKDVLRQENGAFVSFLDQMRFGRLNQADVSFVVSTRTVDEAPTSALCLYPSNDEVNKLNTARLGELAHPAVTFSMIQRQRQTGASDPTLRENFVGPLDRDNEQHLVLKVGARGRLTRNYAPRTNGAGKFNGAMFTLRAFVAITRLRTRTVFVSKRAGVLVVRSDRVLDETPEPPAQLEELLRNSTMSTLFRAAAVPRGDGKLPVLELRAARVRGLTGNGFAVDIDRSGARACLTYVHCEDPVHDTFAGEHPLLSDRFDSMMDFQQRRVTADGSEAKRTARVRYAEDTASALRYYLPVVQFDSEPLTEDGRPALWVVPPCLYTSYVYEHRRSVPVTTQVQLPMLLAYASTIHRSQGMSLQSAAISARYFNTAGLLYTAFTRIVSLEGLYLVGDIAWWRNVPDPNVVCFYTAVIGQAHTLQQQQ
jgi:ATP-dependent DNA helicase PIF1